MRYPATAISSFSTPGHDEAVEHLYVHIPFCPSKCPYCAFVTHVGSLKLVDPYLEALVREAELVSHLRPRALLQTVYFGGGTPSLLSPSRIGRLLRHFGRIFGFAPGCEISIEAHPSTVSVPWLRAIRQKGVNRISFGVESLIEGELAALNRSYPPEQAVRLIAEARETGFTTVNADLIYGLPRQTLESWTTTLERAIGAGPDHLSLYPLSVEPRTVFARLQKRGRLELPFDESVADMYFAACDRLSSAGYVHYEVANWCRPGHESRHNLGYWRNREFFGIGAGAHGYLRPYRSENIPRTRRYIESVMAGELPHHVETLVDKEIELTETVMLRLRLLEEGLDTAEIRARFGIDLRDQLGDEIRRMATQGFLREDGDKIFLSERAVPVANEIWERFAA